MNRSELIGDVVAELVRVLPDKEAELDGDDLDTVRDTVEEVLKNAEEAIDAADDEPEE